MGLPLRNKPTIISTPGFMAISQVQDPGSISANFDVDQVGQVWQGSRQYTQTIRVITTYAAVLPLNIVNYLQSIGIVLGAHYVAPIAALSGATEQDTGSFLQQIRVELETEDGLSWIVTLTYGPFDIWHELGNSNVQFMSFDPTDFPAVVKWSTNKYHRSYVADVNGIPFTNTAGDPLENPPQREESTQGLRIILWFATYEEPFAQSFRDTINKNNFLGFTANTVKCKDVDGERIYTADYGYVWRVTFDFEIRVIVLTAMGQPQLNFGWEDLVLNAGFRAFGPGGGPLAPIIIGGQPVTSPQLLNPNGTAFIPGNVQDVINLNGNANFYLVFQNYRISDFDLLNIPDDILTANQ